MSDDVSRPRTSQSVKTRVGERADRHGQRGMKIAIRAAERADAPSLADLMVIAGDGIPLEVWRRHAMAGQHPLEIGVARAARDEGAFSFRNAWVATADGKVVGMAFGYQLEDAAPDPAQLAMLPPNVVPFAILEGRVRGSFYLNGLAVYPRWQRRGVGRLLLRAAFERARVAGCDRISLTMFAGNASAAALYAGFGFAEIARRLPLRDPAHRWRGDVVLLDAPVQAGRGDAEVVTVHDGVEEPS